MTDAEKAARLRQAMDHLEDAEEIVLSVLGHTDAGDATRQAIGAAIEDLMYDILELEGEE